MKIPILPLMLLTLWFGAAPSTAAPSADVVAEWNGLAAMATSALRSRDYAKAKRVSAGLLTDMAERLGPADQAASTLANILVIEALAEHGLGDDRDATWHWHMAQALDRSVIDRAFAKHANDSVFLEANLLRDPLIFPDVHNLKSEPDIRPPVPRKRKAPRYPYAAGKFGVSGTLIVGAVIGTDGIAHHPKVLQALPAATLTMAALEALKDWQFDPATLNGRPVPVLFGLTVNYQP